MAKQIENRPDEIRWSKEDSRDVRVVFPDIRESDVSAGSPVKRNMRSARVALAGLALATGFNFSYGDSARAQSTELTNSTLASQATQVESLVESDAASNAQNVEAEEGVESLVGKAYELTSDVQVSENLTITAQSIVTITHESEAKIIVTIAHAADQTEDEDSEVGAAVRQPTIQILDKSVVELLEAASAAEAVHEPEKIEKQTEIHERYQVATEGLRFRTSPNTATTNNIVEQFPNGLPAGIEIVVTDTVQDEQGRGVWYFGEVSMVVEDDNGDTSLVTAEGYAAGWDNHVERIVIENTTYDGIGIGGPISEQELHDRFEEFWPGKKGSVKIISVENSGDEELIMVDLVSGNHLAEFRDGKWELVGEIIDQEPAIDEIQTFTHTEALEKFGSEYAEAFEMLPEKMSVLNHTETAAKEIVISQNAISFYEKDGRLHMSVDYDEGREEFIWFAREGHPAVEARNNWKKLEFTTDRLRWHRDSLYNVKDPFRDYEYPVLIHDTRVVNVVGDYLTEGEIVNKRLHSRVNNSDTKNWFADYGFILENEKPLTLDQYEAGGAQLDKLIDAFYAKLQESSQVRVEGSKLVFSDGVFIDMSQKVNVNIARFMDAANKKGLNYEGGTEHSMWPIEFAEINGSGQLTIDLVLLGGSSHTSVTTLEYALAKIIEERTELERDADDESQPRFNSLRASYIKIVQVERDGIVYEVIVHPISQFVTDTETLLLEIN